MILIVDTEILQTQLIRRSHVKCSTLSEVCMDMLYMYDFFASKKQEKRTAYWTSTILTHKAPPIICSRRQFQMLRFKNNK